MEQTFATTGSRASGFLMAAPLGARLVMGTATATQISIIALMRTRTSSPVITY